jgi:hypothetical protein
MVQRFSFMPTLTAGNGFVNLCGHAATKKIPVGDPPGFLFIFLLPHQS